MSLSSRHIPAPEDGEPPTRGVYEDAVSAPGTITFHLCLSDGQWGGTHIVPAQHADAMYQRLVRHLDEVDPYTIRIVS